MPLNGSGTYNLPNPPVFPAVPGTTIKASDFNAIMTDMAAAISAMIARDGQSTITGVLQWAQPGLNLAALGGVALTGAQTIAGVKTFSSAPVSSAAAAAANELMRKGEVDAAVATKADLAGSASQVFSVAAATDPAHALRLGQINTPNAASVKAALNASGDPPIYACRAWVNFQGTGTVAIRASGNVVSITDIGTGFYDVVFATPMPDTNYATILGSGNDAAGIHGSQQAVYHRAPATTFVAILAADDTGQSGAEDCPWVDVAIFR